MGTAAAAILHPGLPRRRHRRHHPCSSFDSPCRPYWTGKAPDWAAGEDEGAAALVAAQSTAAAPAALPAAALMGPAAAADPRLLRLTQRDSAAAGRRGTSEAVVVRRRLRSPSMEAGVPPERGREHEQARQSPQREMQPLPGDDEDEEDEEAIAARRLAIRARQLVAAADAAGAAVGGEEVRPALLPAVVLCVLRRCR